jgi:hypothetical protein
MTTTRNSDATNARQLVRWFGCLVLTGPIHMAEQVMFGLDTLDELKGMTASYYSFFSNADVGTVMLVIFIVTLVQSLLLATLAGGRWRLSVAGFFGVAGIAEVHHVLQTLWHRAYFPGAVTSVAYIWVGVMILRAVIRQWNSAAALTPGQVAAA